jgi:hypothetical protein
MVRRPADCLKTWRYGAHRARHHGDSGDLVYLCQSFNKSL